MSNTGQESELKHWGEVDGVSIDFPMVVEDMNSATLTWTVPIEPARALLPGTAFEVADMGDGTAMLIVALVDYVDNPWGDYDEANFGLLVHPTGRPDEVGAFQWRMPVNQTMTCHAGNQVMGLPKTVEEIAFGYSDDTVRVDLAMDGAPALSVTLPRAEPTVERAQEPTFTYSYLDGIAMAIPLTIQLSPGVVDPADVTLELGTAPVADELRSLGLPRAPDLAMWGEGLSGTFGWPEPLHPF